MNAKKCKSLRRLARVATVGKPEVTYLQENNQVSRKTGERFHGTVRVSPLCTRGTYLAMKRGAA